MQCNSTLSYAMLCSDVLYYSIPSYALLYYTMLCEAMQCCTILSYSMLCSAVLYCSMPSCAVLHYTVLCSPFHSCSKLSYTKLCSAVLCYLTLFMSALYSPCRTLLRQAASLHAMLLYAERHYAEVYHYTLYPLRRVQYLLEMCVKDSGAEWDRPALWNSAFTELLRRTKG